ncbi:uncharacterized protein F5147DRAFT_820148 [Suillus discolor]|uniref:Uncharacterized protein n=1 Tax=Suillus discolor TaxID=1912936 RepID=A0A9P7FDF7_9AGAM|nr:uncharacterized protein F5147DRAFT_820148 [Suillus discolor]KAG2115117.1 hypothetical protein F5147DRAFT_820148 [Suillus discolor]
MNAFPNGTRVLYCLSGGEIKYGTVQATNHMADGTQIVVVKVDGEGHAQLLWSIQPCKITHPFIFAIDSCTLVEEILGSIKVLGSAFQGRVACRVNRAWVGFVAEVKKPSTSLAINRGYIGVRGGFFRQRLVEKYYLESNEYTLNFGHQVPNTQLEIWGVISEAVFAPNVNTLTRMSQSSGVAMNPSYR